MCSSRMVQKTPTEHPAPAPQARPPDVDKMVRVAENAALADLPGGGAGDGACADGVVPDFPPPAQGPRANDLAQMVVSVVNLTRTALINAEPRRRRNCSSTLPRSRASASTRPSSRDEIEPLPDSRPLILLTEAIRRSLGEQTRFAASWEGLEGFWVKFQAGSARP